MNKSFLDALQDVNDNPLLPFVRSEWVRLNDDGVIECACPLTQVAMKNGFEVEDETLGSDICSFLCAKFDLASYEPQMIFSPFDDGASLPVVINLIKRREGLE